MAGDFYGRLRSFLGIGPAPRDLDYVAPAPVGWGSDPLKSGSGVDRFSGRGAMDPAPAPAWRAPATLDDLERARLALDGPPRSAAPAPVLVDQLETGVGATPIRPRAQGMSLPPLEWEATRPVMAAPGSALADVAEAAQLLEVPRTPMASPDPANALRLESAMGQAPSFGTEIPVDGSLVRPGLAPASDAAAKASNADTAIARAAARRSGGRNAFDAALGMADLGIGGLARGGLRNGAAVALKNGMPNLAAGLKGAGTLAAVGAPALAYGAALLPVATGAVEGYQQAGTGGALIQGGTAGAGALAGGLLGSAILPGIGTVIGAGLGSALGSAGGGLLTKGAMAAVDAAEAGDGGLMGAIGNALDPILDSTFEKEQKQLLQMDNSPVMARLRDEQKLREAKARQAQTEQLLHSIYAT